MALNFSMIVAVVVGVFGMATAGGIVAPVVPAAAPVVAYAKAVPYNVPPFASRVDINTKALAPIIAAPFAAAPIAAAPFAAYTAPVPVPAIAPGAVIGRPTYAGSLAAPLAHYAAAAYGPAVLG